MTETVILLALVFCFAALFLSQRSARSIQSGPPYSQESRAAANWAWTYLLFAAVFLAAALYWLWGLLAGGA